MKRWSTPYVTTEKQIKTRYHYIPNRMPKSETRMTPYADKDVKQQEFSFIDGGKEKWYSHFGRYLNRFLQKTINIFLPYDTAIMFLGINTKKLIKLMSTQNLVHGSL